MCAWDYQKMPEIFDDICKEYQSEYGSSIREGVSAALRPCIIKFETDYFDKDVAKATIVYSYLRGNGKKLVMDANTCFNAKGKIVPRKNILKVDYLDKDVLFCRK